jgi:hypothetical protein
VSLRVSAKTIDQVALAALATLVVSYALIVGDASSPSASWVWLGVAVILLASNAARLNVGARPSERGVAVGVAALALALLRITGIVAEVTLPIATFTVGASLLLPSVVRRLSWAFRRF